MNPNPYIEQIINLTKTLIVTELITQNDVLEITKQLQQQIIKTVAKPATKKNEVTTVMQYTEKLMFALHKKRAQ